MNDLPPTLIKNVWSTERIEALANATVDGVPSVFLWTCTADNDIRVERDLNKWQQVLNKENEQNVTLLFFNNI